MTARSIALQGIGYSARLVALHGFGAGAVVTQPPVMISGGRIDRLLEQQLAEDEIIFAVVAAALQTRMIH